MPVSSELAAGLAQATVDLYADAERLLLAQVARQLGERLDSPTWAEQKLLAVQFVRAQASRLLDQLDEPVAQAIATAVSTAYNRGGAQAVLDLAEALGGDPETYADSLPGKPPVDLLVRDTVTRTRTTHRRIVRTIDDAYRQVIARVVAQPLLGTQTPRDAAQQALDDFAARGITGFVDRSGRRWDLVSYVEMAVRTATAQAAVQAHVDRLVAYGEDLVIVSDAPQECAVCRPWEGRVLSLTGGTVGTITGAGGVRVAGSLATAQAAGLLHPGCRHSLSLFQPGVTRVPTGTADPAGDVARQRLRYLERKVRAARRQEAAALDDRARRAAAARVKAGQAAIRQHVADTGAKRQPQRERLGVR